MKRSEPPQADASTDQQLMDRFIRRFRLGVSLFFVGFVVLYAIDQLMEPSIFQEALAMMALVVVAGGLSLALGAELVFIFQRVIGFFSSK